LRFYPAGWLYVKALGEDREREFFGVDGKSAACRIKAINGAM